MSQGITAGLPPSPPPPPPRSDTRGRGDAPECPYCGAKRITSASVPCWLCQEMLPPLEGPVPGGSVQGPASRVAAIVVGILVLLIGTGLALAAPGLFLVLALIATPILIRSVVVTRRARREGRPMTGEERVSAFFATLGAVILVGIATIVAFFVTCFAVCLGMLAVSEGGGRRGVEEWILPVSVIAGLVPGILVLVWLTRVIRRRWQA
jgi:hypothetical protein